MQIKILCSCGSKYKFDVEPVNGRVPVSLSCPQCGASWTDYANAYIAQTLGITPAAAAPPSTARVTVATVASPAVTVQSPVPPAAPVASSPPVAVKLQVNRHQSAPAEAAATPLPGAPADEPLSPVEEGGTVAKPPRKPSFALGVVGAVAGAAVGATIFFLVFYYTGFQFKLLAVGVGFLAGLGARVLGKEGSTELGILTGIFTLLGIFSAEYYWAKALWGKEIGEESPGAAYEAAVAEAKKVVKAIPTGSDEEIRLYLAREEADEGEKPNPASVAADEIKEFREEMLPHHRDLASGKITREDFEKQERAAMEQDKSDKAATDKDSEENYFKYFLIMVFVNRFNIVCVCAAVALAYKMSTDA